MAYQLFLTRAARRSLESLPSGLQEEAVAQLKQILPVVPHGPDVRLETTPEGQLFFVAQLPHSLEAAYGILDRGEAARQADFDSNQQQHLVLYGIRLTSGQEDA